MKTFFLLFSSLLFPLLLFPQELPIDFSDPFHQFVNDPVTSPTQFNLIADPNDATNDVAEIVNIDGIFKEYDLRLSTLVDVSDPNDNTILLDYYNIIDQTQQIIVALDNEVLGGFPVGVVANSSGVLGWETISFDFDNAINLFVDDSEPVILSQYGMITLYIYNVPPSTITTCYIDNIRGAQNGAPYREFDGDVVLTSQQEVNDFGAMGYSKVNGSLHIIPQNGSTTTDVIDLSSLNTIHTIGISNQSDTFEIRGHNNLMSLIGLENLKHLYASFIIKDNPMLQSLSDLTSLDDYVASPSSAGELIIDNNDSLTNLNGLNNITMRSDVIISNNDNLLIIDNITVESYDIHIENNPLLSSIQNVGADNISALTIRNNDNLTLFSNINIPRIKRDLIIDDNDALINLNGLNNPALGVIVPIGQIEVLNNDNLQSLNGLNTDLSLVGRILIENNSVLTDISFLNNFTQNTLIIKDNDMIASLSPLSNYTGGNLTIDGNALLTDLTGLSSYTNAPQLNIYNTNLTSVNGLGNIITIGNSLRIENNHSLTDLSGLSTVQSIGFSGAVVTDFIITNNDVLTNLDGFTSLTNIEADIEFTDNALLDDFCGVETAINNGLVRAYDVTNNLYNPTVQEFNDGMCRALSIDEFDSATINVFPNPTSDFISIDTEYDILKMTLHDIQGQEISCNYENGKLDVTNVASGMYILKIIDDKNRVATFNIVKE